ncbi:MAG: hypothetical protein AAFY52_00060 [Pseudomonadota bacterium]
MRATTFAAGLILGAGTALAGADNHFVPDPSRYVSLDNGCVYGPSLLGTENEWSLVYSQAGTTVTCALTVYGISNGADASGVVPTAPEPAVTEPRTVAQGPIAPLRQPAPRPRIKRASGFLVGVFR